MAGQRLDARRALLDAFSELTLSRHYADFGVDQIIRRAQVARSTFYYHFRDKDELLAQNLRPLILAAARLPLSPAPTAEAEGWASHLWEHRAVANRLLARPVARRLAQSLADELALTLRTSGHADAPAGLLAQQIAGAMTGLLLAWLAGRATASPAQIAHRLWAGARALVEAEDAMEA